MFCHNWHQVEICPILYVNMASCHNLLEPRGKPISSQWARTTWYTGTLRKVAPSHRYRDRIFHYILRNIVALNPLCLTTFNHAYMMCLASLMHRYGALRRILTIQLFSDVCRNSTSCLEKSALVNEITYLGDLIRAAHAKEEQCEAVLSKDRVLGLQIR